MSQQPRHYGLASHLPSQSHHGALAGACAGGTPAPVSAHQRSPEWQGACIRDAKSKAWTAVHTLLLACSCNCNIPETHALDDRLPPKHPSLLHTRASPASRSILPSSPARSAGCLRLSHTSSATPHLPRWRPAQQDGNTHRAHHQHAGASVPSLRRETAEDACHVATCSMSSQLQLQACSLQPTPPPA